MDILRDIKYQGIRTVEMIDNGVLHIRKECDTEIGGRKFKYLQEYDGGETFTTKVVAPDGKVLGEGTYSLGMYGYPGTHRYFGYDKKGREFEDGVYTGKVGKDVAAEAFYNGNEGFIRGEYVSGQKIRFDCEEIIIDTLNEKGLVKEKIEINGGYFPTHQPPEVRKVRVYKFNQNSERIGLWRGGSDFHYIEYKEETYTPDGKLYKISPTLNACNEKVRIGSEELYDENERLQSIISYKDNQKDEATFYNPDGSIKEKVDCTKDLNTLLQVLVKTDNAEEAFDLIVQKCHIYVPQEDESETFDSRGNFYDRENRSVFYRDRLLGRDVKHIKDNLFVIGAVFADKKRGFIYGTADTDRRCTGKLVDIEKGEVLSDVNFGYGKIKTKDFIKIEDGKVYIDYQPEKKQFMIPEELSTIKSRVESLVEKRSPKAPQKSVGKVIKKPKIYE